MSQMHSYPKTNPNPDFSLLEKEVQKFWRENKVFEQSVENRKLVSNGKKNEEYVFYDGPPFANGLPHYGHLLTGFVKDVFARYHTMRGEVVDRKFGWDTHGLPVEMETEKELSISGRIAIEEYGIDKFNDACKTSVMKYASQWKDYVTRQGRWVDFDGGYKTMDINYMESVIWAFKELYKKGLIYEDMRVMPYSWKCQTPLSNFETRLDNSYREKESKAVTLAFELKDALPGKNYDNLSILVWTTTPWTLPSNLALAVGKDIDYVIVEKDQKNYIIAKNLAGKYAKELAQEKELNIIDNIKGSSLIGLNYKPVFNYISDNPSNYDLSKAWKIYAGDFVTLEDGTGVVHIAPGFGEDDQLLCKTVGIPTICPVNEGGEFTSPIDEFKGQQVFETNVPLIKKLKAQGNWIKTEQYIHNYPHCWRSDTPLIYRALPSWYVRVTDFKDRMVELNQEINWIPSHIKDGLFGKWLENARDWSISRNRFWGCPVPVWRSDDPKYPRIDVYGSLDEIEKDFGVRPDNLHRPYIDELTRPNPDDPTGKSTMRRVSDVLDCWFESGSMPYAQAHYPFENKDWFENNFPADFIVEYVAQTRGWFYTLMVLSTALFDRPPFQNCICHGVILDENSEKLSKRLGNYVSPTVIFDKYGADSMRVFMGASTVMKGNELNIDKQGEVFKDAVRLFIKPIWNSYHFFCMYASADKIKAEFSLESKHIMDIYILSKTKKLVEDIKQSLDKYDLPSSYSSIEVFFELLNNWYIRRNRNRFWKSEKDDSKVSAYNTLYTVLNIVSRAIAPLVPHISEAIYQGLESNDKISVQLQDYPNVASIDNALDLVSDMDKVRNICNVTHSIRSKQNIRIRQPLKKIDVIGLSYSHLNDYVSLICDEVNVKQVNFITEIGDLADLKLNLNFKSLGEKYGKKVKEIISSAKQGKWERVDNNVIKISEILLTQGEFNLLLVPKNSDSMNALPEQDALVSLDIKLDDDLIKEGIARDIVRIVQQERKNLDLDITDRIILQLKTESNNVIDAIGKFTDYIKEQTLGVELAVNQNDITQSKHQLDGNLLEINIKKA